MLVLAIAPLSARSMWLVNALTVQLVPLALMFGPRAVRHTDSGHASSSQRLCAELHGATLAYVTLATSIGSMPLQTSQIVSIRPLKRACTAKDSGYGAQHNIQQHSAPVLAIASQCSHVALRLSWRAARAKCQRAW